VDQSPLRDVRYNAAQDALGFREEVCRFSYVGTLAGGIEERNGSPDAEYQVIGKLFVTSDVH